MTNARERVEVVARLGDTILDVRLVDRGGSYRLGEAVLPAVPGIARVGLVDVTIAPVTRPIRSVPYATTGDRRTLPYLAASLAVHVAICGFAMATPVGVGGSVAATERPIHSPRIGWRVGPEGAGGAPAPIAMAREVGPKQARRDPRRLRARPIVDADAPGPADDAKARIAALVRSMDAASSYEKLDTSGGGGGGDGGGGGGGFGGSRDGSLGGEGLVGEGRYATTVAGTAAGGDWAGAGMGGGLRARDSVAPTVIICGGPASCVVTGDMDKAIIRRYIRRQLPRIQYCYEKQLLADGKLAGIVSTEFLIDAGGKVADVTSRGVHDEVASCVGEVLRTIEFPRSATRTSTRVTYPFTFRSYE